jgi:hypothetical protein
MKEKKEKKIKIVKDKEGVVFVLVPNPNITEEDRKIDSVTYVKSFIERQLASNYVFPQNNKVGFKGSIDTVSYFLAGLIESYVKLQFDEKDFELN